MKKAIKFSLVFLTLVASVAAISATAIVLKKNSKKNNKNSTEDKNKEKSKPTNQ
ncbi:hypothetical protein [Metamycoplasma auris]|uniref:hypothetical protein n=1 Tax=Metamycoplasma auris TaxID=51363 RepID=UPI0003A73E42|nr:hypothetical protein [Metamycoplasma auris]